MHRPSIRIPFLKNPRGGVPRQPPSPSTRPNHIFHHNTRRKTTSMKPSGNLVCRQFPACCGGFPAYPPGHGHGGFKQFKIHEVGGLAGNPLLPDLSNAPIPAIPTHHAPDGVAGFAGLSLLSRPGNSQAMKGGVPGQPPTPRPGGLARSGTKGGGG
jgi:hypothetical protein